MKRNWFACELHCHTNHSDGSFTPEALMDTARARLLDGIALTDHNTMSGAPLAAAYAEKPVLLPGVELTTFHGHMPVLAPADWVEWRDVSAEQGDLLIRRAKEAGGTVGIAHPFQLGTPICTGGHWDYSVQDKSQIDYIEIFSEGCPYLNSSNRRAIRLWHSFLDEGLRPAPTMGRDWHRPENNIYPAACTYLGTTAAKLSPQAMLTAICEGRTVVSAGPLFTVSAEDGLTVGDTLNSGKHRLDMQISYTRNDKLNGDTPVACQKIVIRTNGGAVCGEYPIAARCTAFAADVDFRPGAWYSIELWGNIGEKENQLLVITAAMFAAP